MVDCIGLELTQENGELGWLKLEPIANRLFVLFLHRNITHFEDFTGRYGERKVKDEITFELREDLDPIA